MRELPAFLVQRSAQALAQGQTLYSSAKHGGKIVGDWRSRNDRLDQFVAMTKDQGAIDPFERRMRRQARIWRGLDRYRHVLANFLAISGKHTMAGPPKMRRT